MNFQQNSYSQNHLPKKRNAGLKKLQFSYLFNLVDFLYHFSSSFAFSVAKQKDSEREREKEKMSSSHKETWTFYLQMLVRYFELIRCLCCMQRPSKLKHFKGHFSISISPQALK